MINYEKNKLFNIPFESLQNGGFNSENENYKITPYIAISSNTNISISVRVVSGTIGFFYDNNLVKISSIPSGLSEGVAGNVVKEITPPPNAFYYRVITMRESHGYYEPYNYYIKMTTFADDFRETLSDMKESFEQKQDQTDSDLDSLFYFTNKRVPEYTLSLGYYSGTTFSDSSVYSYSTPIRLLKGEEILIKCVCKGANAISLCDQDGSNVSAIVIGDSLDSKNYRYRAIEDCYVIFCFRSASSNPAFVHIYKSSIVDDVNSMQSILKKMNELPLDLSIGGISTTDGNWDNLTTKCRMVDIDKDDTIFISKTSDVKFSIRFYNDTSYLGTSTWWGTNNYAMNLTTKEIWDNTTYISIVFSNIDNSPIDIDLIKNKIKITVENYIYKEIQKVPTSQSDTFNFRENSLRPSLSVLCAKEIRFIDGTAPVTDYYLLADLESKNLYLSKDLNEKTFIFKFDNYIDYYSWAIMPNNDIIAVRNASSLSFETQSDSNRINPYIYKYSEKWSIKHVVEFDGIAPCGWIGNCGFLSSPNGDSYIAEYTRTSVQTANLWKITGDASDPINWSIKKTFVISTNPDAGLKHIHMVAYDHHTGVIYISTGDYEASSIYYSTDDGSTWSDLLLNNEKFGRALNYIFTKDYVYWTTDSSTQSIHYSFRVPRDTNGIIDLSNITSSNEVLLPLYEAYATYATVFIEKLNIVALIERVDGTPNPPVTVPLRVLDLDKPNYNESVVLTNIELARAYESAVNLGFRYSYCEFYPKDTKILIGMANGANNSVRNSNKFFGNSLTNPINNIVLDFYRKSNGDIGCVVDTINI